MERCSQTRLETVMSDLKSVVALVDKKKAKVFAEMMMGWNHGPTPGRN